MTEFVSPAGPAPHIPDYLTLPQFMLDSVHPSRPVRREGIPWLIEDATGRKIGFEEIRSRVFGLANALSLKWNIREDEVVCIFSPNHVDYPTVIWATHRLGAIVTAANPAYSADELFYQLETTKSVNIFVHPAFLPAALAAAQKAGIPTERVIPLDDIPGSQHGQIAPTVHELIAYGLSHPAHFVERHLQPGEAKTKLAFLSFSSGTTGKPKAVSISHYAPIANVIQMAVFHKVNEDYTTWENKRFRVGDIASAVLPFFHIYGLVVNMSFLLYSGLTLVVIPKFEHTKFLESIVKYRITHLSVVPPQVVLLCKHPATRNYDLSHIRFLMCGAAPLSPELTTQLIKVIPNAEIGQGYGMTETCTTVSMWPISQRIGTFGSAGQLMPGNKARVVKEDGTLAKVGEQGELVVTGPSMALQYANNKEATLETFIDGWVRTGDEVIINENNDLFIVDRLKEIMKVRGFQVSPAELEGHLLEHADVADVCVVPVHDDYSGEVPLAFVVLHANAAKRAASSSAEADNLKADIVKAGIPEIHHVADHKVHYKRLAGGVEFIDVIPKNPSGKLLRRLHDVSKLHKQLKSSAELQGSHFAHCAQLTRMVRRIASQVHKQASRLLQAGYLKQKPAWYSAVLENPPLPLPARAPPPRTAYDAPAARSAAKKEPEPRPLPIIYLEDEVRRQFFRDHPFETFRPVTLTEDAGVEAEHPINGLKWMRLRQRGRNPTPEDAIRFTVNLHEHHRLPLTEAYSTAIGQFRALRSEQHIATTFAAQEAEAYGAAFGPSSTMQSFMQEEKVLAAKRLKSEQMDEGELVARKRWHAIVESSGPKGEWSRGEEYVRLWKEGVRPDYSPALTEPMLSLEQTETSDVEFQIAKP
ncbi:hypothetical protein EW146_g2442 [Bondarzewia mesenterica]|uniref:Uncharacterized protein n=1 Tax=Bondarzewia mesenterica TaxID=1095465 RepID=A0A4S4M0V5_9AGAM|nr:hypothetical protein EW146_g2442 [Bondarzewia mesenterica]